MPRLVPTERRRRATASLCLRLPGLLSWIIRASQKTSLGPLVTPQAWGATVDGERHLACGLSELADGARLFDHFRHQLKPGRLTGLRVLDLGCGYGGRSVYYATKAGAAQVVGVEPSSEVVALCEDLARKVACSNVRFRVGIAEDLPFDDASFDAVIAFDVLEHVQDPQQAFREIRRVLPSDGRAWLAFPSYRGARASHLDFITRVPALHRIFDPETIVSVVNSELRGSNGRYGVLALSPPTVSSLGYLTLPSLNGLTRRDARRLIENAGLCMVQEQITPFVRASDPVAGARPLRSLLDRWQMVTTLPDLLIGSLAYELRPD